MYLQKAAGVEARAAPLKEVRPLLSIRLAAKAILWWWRCMGWVRRGEKRVRVNSSRRNKLLRWACGRERASPGHPPPHTRPPRKRASPPPGHRPVGPGEEAPGHGQGQALINKSQQLVSGGWVGGLVLATHLCRPVLHMRLPGPAQCVVKVCRSPPGAWEGGHAHPAPTRGMQACAAQGSPQEDLATRRGKKMQGGRAVVLSGLDAGVRKHHQQKQPPPPNHNHPTPPHPNATPHRQGPGASTKAFPNASLAMQARAGRNFSPSSLSFLRLWRRAWAPAKAEDEGTCASRPMLERAGQIGMGREAK